MTIKDPTGFWRVLFGVSLLTGCQLFNASAHAALMTWTIEYTVTSGQDCSYLNGCWSTEGMTFNGTFALDSDAIPSNGAYDISSTLKAPFILPNHCDPSGYCTYRLAATATLETGVLTDVVIDYYAAYSDSGGTNSMEFSQSLGNFSEKGQQACMMGCWGSNVGTYRILAPTAVPLPPALGLFFWTLLGLGRLGCQRRREHPSQAGTIEG